MFTDIFGYSDTSHRDTQLTMTVLVNPMLAKSVAVSQNLLTVTLFPCLEGITLTEDVTLISIYKINSLYELLALEILEISYSC